jgi:magnesium chelatase family protein
LARSIPGILPEMSIEESLDVTHNYSVADKLPAGTRLIRHRPFCTPHHTISHAGLVGGCNIQKPGEIRMALKHYFLEINSDFIGKNQGLIVTTLCSLRQ